MGKVIEYLGRYTHRVAISNCRLLQIQDSKVSFSWRDYRDHSREKVMTISATEFIRRFMLHILPHGFRKIRHFGIFASRDKSARMKLCRELTSTSFFAPAPASTLDKLRKMLGRDLTSALAAGLALLPERLPTAQLYNFYLPLHWGGGDYTLLLGSVFYTCRSFTPSFYLYS